MSAKDMLKMLREKSKMLEIVTDRFYQDKLMMVFLVVR